MIDEESDTMNFIRLTDFDIERCQEIFKIADQLQTKEYHGDLAGKTVVMFFSDSSIRTRVAFEKGVHLLGGQTILFPPEALDKKERIRDAVGYLNNWANLIVVRHKSIELIQEMANYATCPVINALSDVNHPCEVLSDMYALSKMRSDYRNAKYLFCGVKGNIGYAWKEASEVFGFELEQCCVKGYEMEGIASYDDIRRAIIGKDIIITDSLPAEALSKQVQVTKEIMDMANSGAILNPCPPFFIGEEVSEDAVNSDYFVGYEFKNYLLQVQQAIMIYCLKE